jgi:hypothetical protein
VFCGSCVEGRDEGKCPVVKCKTMISAKNLYTIDALLTTTGKKGIGQGLGPQFLETSAKFNVVLSILNRVLALEKTLIFS